MRSKISRLFIFFFLLLALGLFFSTPALAQQDFNLTASPNSFDITSEPGKTIRQTLKIRNNGNSPITLKIEIKKLLPTKDGKITIEDFKKEDDYQQWIKINSASISATPKEWTFIPVTITIPKEAAFGYYWSLMISPKENKQDQKNAQAHLTGTIAIPILLSVYKDGMKFDGKLESFQVSKNIYEYPPITFLTIFANQGNVHVKPRGNIFITNMLGKQVAVLDINKEQGSVLPNAQRAFSTDWNDSFITEEKIENGKRLKFHFDKILSLKIGQYKAKALVVVSGDKRDYSFESTTTFFVFPWKVILGGLLFVAFALIGAMSTMKATIKNFGRFFRK